MSNLGKNLNMTPETKKVLQEIITDMNIAKAKAMEELRKSIEHRIDNLLNDSLGEYGMGGDWWKYDDR